MAACPPSLSLRRSSRGSHSHKFILLLWERFFRRRPPQADYSEVGSAARGLHLRPGASDFARSKIKGRSLPCPCRSPATAEDANGPSLIRKAAWPPAPAWPLLQTHTTRACLSPILARNKRLGKSLYAEWQALASCGAELPIGDFDFDNTVESC